MQVKVLEIRDEGTYALFAQPESPQQDTVPRSRYDACNADWLEAKAKLKQLEESATAAVLDAYTRCAEICNVKSHRIYDEYGSTDQETGERTIPMRFMDTVEACDDCAEAILAARDELKDKI